VCAGRWAIQRGNELRLELPGTPVSFASPDYREGGGGRLRATMDSNSAVLRHVIQACSSNLPHTAYDLLRWDEASFAQFTRNYRLPA
jgi:hypothetical protein